MALLGSTKALVKGMLTTLKHTVRPAETVQYPEVKRPVAPKFHGRHRLHKVVQDGRELERCIGCHLCAAACPSNAIYVEAADNDPAKPVSPGERYAVHYEINMLRCIFCGYCEEACPVDAIKLGPEYELADVDRHALVYTKEMLLQPDKYAPKPQFHADVDGADKWPSVIKLDPDKDLDTVYQTHHPLGETRAQNSSTSHARDVRPTSATLNEANRAKLGIK